jgi:hypothetical protein
MIFFSRTKSAIFSDRRWFKANPHNAKRIRDLLPDELAWINKTTGGIPAHVRPLALIYRLTPARELAFCYSAGGACTIPNPPPYVADLIFAELMNTELFAGVIAYLDENPGVSELELQRPRSPTPTIPGVFGNA